MAQHDYVIANATGAAVRSDINNGLAAIVSQNSGASAPTTTYAYMSWADTTAGVMKMRNAANNAWITLYQLDGEWTSIALENGTAAAPSIYFKDSGTDTGIYSPGADQVGISTGGAVRFQVSTTAATSTLPIVYPLGAVGTPSITFTGDLNTGIWSPAADTIAFSEGGVEVMRLDASGRLLLGTSANADGGILQLSSGITFPATAVAASDANTLDDYEEGSWTPTYAPSSGSFTTMTVSVQGARYVKIGQQVTVSAYFFTTAVNATGASGSVSISGLPFTTRSTQVVRYGAVLGYTSSFNSKPISAYIDDNSTSIQLLESTTDNDLLDVADLNTTAGNKNFIYVTATYFVN